FLYSSRKLIFSRIISGFTIFLLAIPFTITSTGWNGTFPYPFFFLPIFMLSQLLLAAGFVRHIFQPADSAYDELPAWAQTSAPAGIGLLGITIILTGIWGWPGALQFGSWKIVLSMLVFGVLIIFAGWRIQKIIPTELNTRLNSLKFPQFNIFPKLSSSFWFLFRFSGNLIGTLNDLLEGDGGLLWTLLLLVLFISIFQGSK
ncbi:MAG: hypothetical protein WCP19_02815, partial [Chloroflexota bacterium]